jgi:hypothetical protein
MKNALKRLSRQSPLLRNLMVYCWWLLDRRQRSFLRNGDKLRGVGKGKNCLIVLNSPSVNQQDLRRTPFDHYFFVNRGFLHPDYPDLNPKTNTFVDLKLLTGEWDFGFLETCIQTSGSQRPQFVLSVDYLADTRFADFAARYPEDVFFINDKLSATKRFWPHPDLRRPTCGAAVFGAAINTAIHMGFNPIYFTGFEANGLCYEMIRQDSHHYGTNAENHQKTVTDYIRDLRMMANGLENLGRLAHHFQTHRIRAVNATLGGLLDMFERSSILNPDEAPATPPPPAEPHKK